LLLSPRASTRPILAQMRNQTGGTIAKGKVMKAHSSIEDGLTTMTTSETGDNWVAIAAEDVAALSNGNFAIGGLADVLMTDAVSNGQFVVVDTSSGNEGNGKASATYPTTPGTLVGRCVKGADAGELARVVLSRA